MKEIIGKPYECPQLTAWEVSRSKERRIWTEPRKNPELSRKSREYRKVKTRIHRTGYRIGKSYKRELYRSIDSHTGKIPLSTNVLKCMRELYKARKRNIQRTEEIVPGVPTGPRMVPISNIQTENKNKIHQANGRQ